MGSGGLQVGWLMFGAAFLLFVGVRVVCGFPHAEDGQHRLAGGLSPKFHLAVAGRASAKISILLRASFPHAEAGGSPPVDVRAIANFRLIFGLAFFPKGDSYC